MSLTAQLKFGDNLSGTYTKEYNVTDCKYSVMRHHNCYFPDSDAWCGNVEVTVIAPGKEDLELFEWYSDLQVLFISMSTRRSELIFLIRNSH